MSQTQLIPTASPSPIFNFKDHEIRTIMQDGQPWFVARDVCAALTIDWSGKTLAAMPADWQGMGKLPTPRGGMQQFKLISEPAVYKLAFRSNKPEADAFTNWVASDVLPAIRKTGKYDVAEKPKRERKALPPARPLRGDLSPIQERELQAIDARIRAANAYCWKEYKEISSALLSFAAVNIGSIAVASLADAIFAVVERNLRCKYITPGSPTESTNMLRYFRKSLG